MCCLALQWILSYDFWSKVQDLHGTAHMWPMRVPIHGYKATGDSYKTWYEKFGDGWEHRLHMMMNESHFGGIFLHISWCSLCSRCHDVHCVHEAAIWRWARHLGTQVRVPRVHILWGVQAPDSLCHHADHLSHACFMCEVAWLGDMHILTWWSIPMFHLVGGLENFFFLYIGKNNLKWLSYFSEG